MKKLLALGALLGACGGALAQAPENDECAGALVIPVPAFNGASTLSPTTEILFATPTNTDAATDNVPCADTRHTVWYTFTPTTSGIYDFSTCEEGGNLTTIVDTVMTLYTGACGSLTPISCVDDSCTVGQARRGAFTTSLTAGTTYRLLVGRWNEGPLTEVEQGNGRFQVRVTSFAGTAPPAAEDLGALTPGLRTVNHTLVPGQVKWYRFTLATAVDSRQGTFLDIDTETSGVTATAIALYNTATGARVAQDTIDGSGNLSQISIGAGQRPPFLSSAFYDGRDAGNDPTAPSLLPAGTYHLALSAPSTTFNQAFVVSTTHTTSGNATLRLNLGGSLTPPPCGAGVPILSLPDAGRPGPFVSEGGLNSDANSVFTVPVDLPDGFRIAAVRIQGQVRNADPETFIAEAQVRIIPPTTVTQPPFSIQVLNGAARSGTHNVFDRLVSFVVPIDSPDGDWEFRLFESFNDPGAPDAEWNSICITFVEFVPPPPPPSTTITLVDGQFVVTPLVLAAGQTQWFRIDLPADVTAGAGAALDIDTEGSSLSPENDTRIGLYSSSGILLTNDADDGSGLLSQLSYGDGTRAGVGSSLQFTGRDGGLADGTYYIVVTGGNAASLLPTAFGVTNPSANTGTVNLRVRYLTSTGPTAPPTDAALGDLGASATQTFSAQPGRVYWVSFNLPAGAERSLNTYLDIDTLGSTVADTEIVLYNDFGTLVGQDDNDGPGTLSQLSFGRGDRPAAPGADSFVYNGRDNASLLSGTYYLAVAPFDALYGAEYAVQTSSTAATGTLVVNLRTGEQALPPATFANVGTLDGDTNPIVVSGIDLGFGEVKWIRFTLAADLAVGEFLDIDTEGNPAAADTELGLFAQSGAPVANDDDDGTGTLSQLTFGDFGPRNPPDVVGLRQPYNGRDGSLGAGTYYLAVGNFNVLFGIENFDAVGAAAAASTGYRVNLRTNVQAPPPAGCNVADIVSIGGFPPSDGELTVDDYTSFINAFAGDELLADIVSIGGFPPSDGELTVDDYTSFINAFAEGCPG